MTCDGAEKAQSILLATITVKITTRAAHHRLQVVANSSKALHHARPETPTHPIHRPSVAPSIQYLRFEAHLRHAKTWVAASRSGGRVRDATRTRLSRPLGPGPVPLIYLSISLQ